MKLLIDMNLSPRWVIFLAGAGIESAHWSACGSRPKLENAKIMVSVRYSPEVLSYFKGTGPGWQARMDGVLRQYVEKQTRTRREKAAPKT